MQGQLADIRSIKFNVAGVNVVEAVDQVHDRGLTGSGGTNNGDLLALLRVNVNAMENLFILAVTEVDVLETDPIFDPTQDLARSNRILLILFLDGIQPSVAEVLEEIGGGQVGGHGTTAALAMLNDAVKKGGIMACSHVGGLSGAFIPVSEDAGMIKAVESGTLNIAKLEAMTAVCSVGLDMIAIPGDTPAETISAMIADEAAIGMINNKTTAVRVIPVPGKEVGDTVEFGGLLGHAPIMAVNPAPADRLIHRGGLIPAPIHSFKN